MKSLALVVPCYNEGKRLNAEAFLQALKLCPWLSLVFVNDGSRDATAVILERLAQSSPAVAVVKLPANGGKAAAVRTGIEFALQHSQADLLGFWDADLATPLSALPDFVQAFERQPELMAAIGSRWSHLGAKLKRRPMRRFAAWLVTSFIRWRLGVKVWDTQCGAKVFTRAAAAELFRDGFRTRWLFDVELLARLGRERMVRNVRELPIDAWRDVPGSKLSLAASPRILAELFRLLFIKVS